MQKNFNRKLEKMTLGITGWIGSPLSIILHTIVFIGIFVLKYFNVSYEEIMLILTTIVSLEAIYLSLFIQMSVNNNLKTIEGVEEDIEDIQEDMEETQTSIDMIDNNFQKLAVDVQEISGEIERIEAEDEPEQSKMVSSLSNLHRMLTKVSSEISSIETDIKNLKDVNLKQHANGKGGKK